MCIWLRSYKFHIKSHKNCYKFNFMEIPMSSFVCQFQFMDVPHQLLLYLSSNKKYKKTHMQNFQHISWWQKDLCIVLYNFGFDWLNGLWVDFISLCYSWIGIFFFCNIIFVILPDMTWKLMKFWGNSRNVAQLDTI